MSDNIKKLEESMNSATTPREVSDTMGDLLRNNIKGSIKISGGAKLVITPEFQDVELQDFEMVELAKSWSEGLGNISAAFLQRKLKISYVKAIQLIKLVNDDLVKKL